MNNTVLMNSESEEQKKREYTHYEKFVPDWIYWTEDMLTTICKQVVTKSEYSEYWGLGITNGWFQ